MSAELIHRLTIAHGVVAWLDTVLLLVLASRLFFKQWPDKPWLPRLAVTATLGAWISFALGLTLELHYRVHLRQHLFIASKNLGRLFESKIHLSFGIMTMAGIGLLMFVLSRKNPAYARPMRAAYFIAAFFALATSSFSTIVATAKPLLRE